MNITISNGGDDVTADGTQITLGFSNGMRLVVNEMVNGSATISGDAEYYVGGDGAMVFVPYRTGVKA